MFIGREREVAALDRLYESNKFEFAVIYGRRRVGKTALINHFIDNKEAIYFMGVESNENKILKISVKASLNTVAALRRKRHFCHFKLHLSMCLSLLKRND